MPDLAEHLEWGLRNYSLLLNKCFIKIDHFAFIINPALTLRTRNREGFQ